MATTPIHPTWAALRRICLTYDEMASFLSGIVALGQHGFTDLQEGLLAQLRGAVLPVLAASVIEGRTISYVVARRLAAVQAESAGAIRLYVEHIADALMLEQIDRRGLGAMSDSEVTVLEAEQAYQQDVNNLGHYTSQELCTTAQRLAQLHGCLEQHVQIMLKQGIQTGSPEAEQWKAVILQGLQGPFQTPEALASLWIDLPPLDPALLQRAADAWCDNAPQLILDASSSAAAAASTAGSAPTHSSADASVYGEPGPGTSEAVLEQQGGDAIALVRMQLQHEHGPGQQLQADKPVVYTHQKQQKNEAADVAMPDQATCLAPECLKLGEPPVLQAAMQSQEGLHVDRRGAGSAHEQQARLPPLQSASGLHQLEQHENYIYKHSPSRGHSSDSGSSDRTNRSRSHSSERKRRRSPSRGYRARHGRRRCSHNRGRRASPSRSHSRSRSRSGRHVLCCSRMHSSRGRSHRGGQARDASRSHCISRSRSRGRGRSSRRCSPACAGARQGQNARGVSWGRQGTSKGWQRNPGGYSSPDAEEISFLKALHAYLVKEYPDGEELGRLRGEGWVVPQEMLRGRLPSAFFKSELARTWFQISDNKYNKMVITPRDVLFANRVRSPSHSPSHSRRSRSRSRSRSTRAYRFRQGDSRSSSMKRSRGNSRSRSKERRRCRQRSRAHSPSTSRSRSCTRSNSCNKRQTHGSPKAGHWISEESAQGTGELLHPVQHLYQFSGWRPAAGGYPSQQAEELSFISALHAYMMEHCPAGSSLPNLQYKGWIVPRHLQGPGAGPAAFFKVGIASSLFNIYHDRGGMIVAPKPSPESGAM